MANTPGNALSQRETCDGRDLANWRSMAGFGAIFSVSPLRAAHLVNCALARTLGVSPPLRPVRRPALFHLDFPLSVCRTVGDLAIMPAMDSEGRKLTRTVTLAVWPKRSFCIVYCRSPE